MTQHDEVADGCRSNIDAFRVRPQAVPFGPAKRPGSVAQTRSGCSRSSLTAGAGTRTVAARTGYAGATVSARGADSGASPGGSPTAAALHVAAAAAAR